MNKIYVGLTTIVTTDAMLGFALHSKSFTGRTYNTTSRVFNRIYLRKTQFSKLYLFWFDIEKSYLGTVRWLDLYKRVTSLQLRAFIQVNEVYGLFKQMNYRLKCTASLLYSTFDTHYYWLKVFWQIKIYFQKTGET